jgi:hypothetical protein
MVTLMLDDATPCRSMTGKPAEHALGVDGVMTVPSANVSTTPDTVCTPAEASSESSVMVVRRKSYEKVSRIHEVVP